MRKFLLFPLVLLFAFFGFSQTNLVQNGDFENWTGNQMDNWTNITGQVLRNQSDFTSGLSSIQIYSSSTSLDAVIESQTINLESGKTYVFRYDTKTTTTTGTSTSSSQAIQVLIKRPNGVSSSHSPLSELNSWDTNQFTFEAPMTGLYTLELSANNNLAIGVEDILVDNTKLFEVSELQENIDDKNALIALYNSTSGANWSNLWDLTSNMNFWYGVDLNEAGRVIKLNLRSNNLIGMLPLELGNLTELKEIKLNRTFTIGQIPNAISGSIPSTFGNLKELQILNLGSLGLTGSIPSEVGEMTALKELILNSNDLTGTIPTSIGNLSNLEYFDISTNFNLSGAIPSQLGQLIKLEVFSSTNTNLSGNIPSALGQMTSLKSLSLSGNSLTGAIPNELGQLQNLTILNLSLNQLSEPIPTSLGQLPLLELLLLGQNNLTGTIPPSLGQLSNLSRLNLRLNELEGSIPTELGLLQNLTEFYASGNNLTSSVPSFLNNDLNRFDISRNNFVFDDFLPSLNNQANAVYDAQSNIGETEEINKSEGENFSITVTETTDDNNTYQWRKNNTIIDGATNPTFSITNVELLDSGFYDCLINNTAFTALELTKNAIRLRVSTADSDNDGVTDTLDTCPNTPTGESVDNNGCSQSQLDDDNDGVTNNNDNCPNTPSGETVDANGCSQSQLDDDNDGVTNDIDICPNTPTGETANVNGCSQSQLDDDNDGITNNIDSCPNTPTGETVDSNGCAQSQLDDDNDGVTNNNDNCPNTPSEETVDTNGCSQSQLDDDNDGVTNNNDNCPNTPSGEAVDTNGCSQSELDDDNDGVTNSNDTCPNTPTGNTVDAQGCIVTNANQINYLTNFSFENWSGTPETPDSWTIENENSLTKSTEATDGSFSLELDLNNSLANKTALLNETAVQLTTNTTYTYAFDYKVNRGTNISAQIQVTKDGSPFSIRIAEEFVPFNDDGNWHTFSFDFDTNGIDEEHFFRLEFRANTATTGIVQLDNLRVLGDPILDGDGDGVPDGADLCPNTAPGVITVDENGCEIQIDLTNLLEDPSFEDWSLNGGTNLRNWGRVLAGTWQKNTDISDDLLYSLEQATSSNGFSSIFQNDIDVYKNVTYTLSVDYKVLEGSFNKIEFELNKGIFDVIEVFTNTNIQSGWNTYSVSFTAPNTETIDLNIRAYSDLAAGRILFDNSVFRVAADQSTLDDDNDGVTNDKDNCPNTPTGVTVDSDGCPVQTSNDVDNDGVDDSNDTCPNTPAGETVDANGCSQSQLDDDNDGVNNNLDTCPNTPAGETVDANGCSESQLDDDNDGVNNDLDTCPNTPIGTTVDAEGCPVQTNNDADNDGVNDDSDNCPNTPTGETVDANGCAQSQLDDDNDGVNNNLDTCPNTPAGETVDTEGCPVQTNNDADNDGVNDDSDNCPNTPAGETVDTNGCAQSQLDDDNDGVSNDNDICPNTPSGVTVDAQGCATNQSSEPNIPNNGIQVKATSTTCLGSENGEISVSFNADYPYTYTVRITANLLDNTFDNIESSTGLVRSNLPADTYTVCISIPEYPNFERCSTIKVETPEDFTSGKIVVDNDKRTGKMVVSGSKNYVLLVNDKEFNYSFDSTANRELSFELEDGVNSVVAKTDKACQGKYEESVLLNIVRTYPNPVVDNTTIVGIQNVDEADIIISDMRGVIVKRVRKSIDNSVISLSVEELPTGVYFVRIISDKQDVQTKIVKK